MTPLSPQLALCIVQFLVAAATLIGALELLHQRRLFHPGQLYATPPRRAHLRVTAAIRVPLTPLLQGRPILALLTLQVVLALIILWQTSHLSLSGLSRAMLLALLTVTAFLLHLRDHDSSTGADRFLLQLLPACAFAELIGTPTARTLVLFFIAAQAALVYATTGILKLRHAPWRNGSALLHILSSAQQGNRTLYLFFARRPRLARLCGLAVCAEILLAFAAFTPPAVCLVLLALGLLMHLAVARLMGPQHLSAGFPRRLPRHLLRLAGPLSLGRRAVGCP